MKISLPWISVFLVPLSFAVAQEQLQPMPAPVTNNAVAGVRIEKQLLIYSFMGLGPKKSWDSATNAAFALNLKYDAWTAIKPVPGSGRLGAVAVGVKEQIFLLGGYVPDPAGDQTIVADLSIYEPSALRWYRGAEMPVAVGEAVAGGYRDRYMYVIGGRMKTGPTSQVQVYDTLVDKWFTATPSPGTPVFGHAGAVVNDTIVYVDGAQTNPGAAGPRAEGASGERQKYFASDECWIGKIDHHDPSKIQWSKLPPHPGNARYRIAAGGSQRDQRIYFAGGSNKAYDDNGIGLDGKPAEPSSIIFAFNVRSGGWETIRENAQNSTQDQKMDEHSLVVTSNGLIVAGGMAAGQKVTDTTAVLPKGR